ncbi:hypothetical protein [Gloeothece verrucosa]|uniref:Uncharacterized protein n=1 Tax=Gloeothece verrucosa (strain PCC 7822) TaxID=497965 RepID=E0ULQ7_GLOV7|nr:hypothetical protein [Gloeothece verrucosa]ADN17887.1 hypothetical protein Cyan7822_6040 [Gloeothece verrucosa PCC 7822]
MLPFNPRAGENDEVNLIISEAILRGFICQIDENKKWKIHFSDDWALSQTETEWLLLFKAVPQMAISHEKLLKMLRSSGN